MSIKNLCSPCDVNWFGPNFRKRGGMICAVLSFYSFLFISPGWAQRAAELAGSIKDSSGAAAVGVNISATNERTGVKTTTTSNESGLYRFVELVAAPYKIEAT